MFMRYFRIAFVFGLALMIFAGCSKEEIQPDSLNVDDSALKSKSVKKKPDKLVPLKGVFEVKVIQVIQEKGPRIQIVAGEGNLSHLGRTEVSMTQYWRGPNPNLPDGAMRGGSGDGEITFVAANGDILKASYYGTSIHWSLTSVEIDFVCTIVGGEGRFKDAKGDFSWKGQYTPLPVNIGNADVDGGINY